MNVLIKSATIIDPKSDFNNQTKDILVENGTITKIGSRISNTDDLPVIKRKNLCVSQGWFDPSVSFGEPGYEERETIANGLRVAAHSGFTAVALNANTNPTPDTGSDIAFTKAKAQGNAVDLLPIGSLSKDGQGKALAELHDMMQFGAVAFCDYQSGIESSTFMKIALQYAQSFDGLICSFPIDKNFVGDGVMHEAVMSTSLGLKGIPALSETIQIARDLQLLEYTGGKLHIPTISARGSVELIRHAKEKNLDVSCSVAVHNLLLTDESLNQFDTNHKVLPPLREKEDIEALISGLKDGTIDMVTSDHNPLDIELKKLEFDHAAFGTIGLETAFPALRTIFPLRSVVKFLTRGRDRFGIHGSSINIGNKANLSLFDPDESFVYASAESESKSKNSIFDGMKLKGRVYGIINNNQTVISH